MGSTHQVSSLHAPHTVAQKKALRRMLCAPHAVLSRSEVVLTLLPFCRLDALLSALSKGKGEQLTNPWPIIHPDNAVTSLSQALDPKHDAFYRKLPKFKFLSCLDHYEAGEYGTPGPAG